MLFRRAKTWDKRPGLRGKRRLIVPSKDFIELLDSPIDLLKQLAID